MSLAIMLALASCSNQSVEKSNVPHAQTNASVLQHLQYLSSDTLQGRKFASNGSKLTQAYLVGQLSMFNVQPLTDTYAMPFVVNTTFKSTHGNNIVALIPGTANPDKFIVLSAHFDHLGVKGRRIFNGADDNASGTAALLDYAKRLQVSPLRYSVIILFTDAEEANLKGAKAFIAQNQHLLSNIILNINVDMIAGSKRTKRLRYISRGLDTLLSKEKLLAYQQHQKQGDLILKKGFRQLEQNKHNNIKWEIASDHGVFYRNNIPFIYFGVGTHSNYHEVTDTYENVNHTFFIHAVESIYQQLRFLDRNL